MLVHLYSTCKIEEETSTVDEESKIYFYQFCICMAGYCINSYCLMTSLESGDQISISIYHDIYCKRRETNIEFQTSNVEHGILKCGVNLE